jgi:hypothetical protein
LKDGKPVYAHNFLGLKTSKIAGDIALPKGKATIRFEFSYDGRGFGKGGVGRPGRTHQSLGCFETGAE